MGRLLRELDQAGVEQAWLEARTPTLMRTRGYIRPTLRVDFAYPLAEPLVWIADIVVGAVTAARGDGDLQYLARLERLLTEHQIRI